MMSRLKRVRCAVHAWALLSVMTAATAAADEAFYRVPITDLKFTAGKLPDESDDAKPGPRPVLSFQSVTPRGHRRRGRGPRRHAERPAPT